MVEKKTRYTATDLAGFRRAGEFETRLTLLVSQELNRRKIRYRLDDIGALTTVAFVAEGSAAEAAECIEDIKRRNKRVRL